MKGQSTAKVQGPHHYCQASVCAGRSLLQEAQKNCKVVQRCAKHFNIFLTLSEILIALYPSSLCENVFVLLNKYKIGKLKLERMPFGDKVKKEEDLKRTLGVSQI